MPKLDGRDNFGAIQIAWLTISTGIGATTEIRRIESARRKPLAKQAVIDRAGILALTGMSSLEDKRKAFDAGVDG
jgi:hypothetical protein